MLEPTQDLKRRRPVWDALSAIFLDTEVDDDWLRAIARTLEQSGYNMMEVEQILWDELYPLLKSNLSVGAGEWAGFDLDWMQSEILSRGKRASPIARFLGSVLQVGTAWMVQQEWRRLTGFFSDTYRAGGCGSS